MGDLIPVEFKNQRILTTEQLAEIYNTDTNNIKNNYNNHKINFKEGKHYFYLEGEELREFKNCVNNIDLVDKHTRNLYLWTERGANRHCKILDTDKAWEQFDNLEETYFKVKECTDKQLYSYMIEDPIKRAERWIKEQKEKQLLLEDNIKMKPKAESYDAFLNADGNQTVKQVANALGLGQKTLFSILRENKILTNANIPYQRYLDNEYFVVKEKILNNNKAYTQTFVTVKGVAYIEKLINNKNIIS